MNPPDKQLQLDNYRDRLLEALHLPVKIATQSINSIVVLLIINIGSAAWLSFFLWQRFNVNILLIFIVTLIVCLPSYSLGYLYVTLKEIIVLPERITTYFQTVQQTFAEFGEAHEKVLAHSKDNLEKDSSKFLSGKKRQLIFAIGQRLKDWYFLAKKLKEVKSLINDSQDLLVLTFQAMALTNPIFLLFVTIAVVLTLVYFFVALVTLVFYLFSLGR
jgi:ABC-type multidrug transport system fused ATPase/permease subunit